MDAPEQDRSGGKQPEDWRTAVRKAGPYLGLGLQLAGAVFFFTFGGYLLDRWLGTLPWLTVAGAVLGMVAMFVQLFSTTAEMSRKERSRREGR